MYPPWADSSRTPLTGPWGILRMGWCTLEQVNGAAVHIALLCWELSALQTQKDVRVSCKVPQGLPIPALHRSTKCERDQGFSFLFPSPQQCGSTLPSTSIAVSLLCSLFAHYPFYPNSNSHLFDSARSASFCGNLSWAKKPPSLGCNPRSSQAFFILNWDLNWPGICLLRMVVKRSLSKTCGKY